MKLLNIEPNEINSPKKIKQRTNDSQNKSNNNNGSLLPKILSVLAAIALWLYVFQAVEYEKTFKDIPVVVENFDSETGLEIVNSYDSTIDVTLSGTKSIINEIYSSDISAIVDMKGVTDIGTHSLPVHIEAPVKANIVDKSIDQVRITLDKKVTEQRELSYELVSYSIQSPYELGDVLVTGQSVELSGPETDIKKVKRAIVRLSLGQVKNSIDINEKVVLLDEKGKELDSKYITKYPSTVHVHIPVYKTQSVPVNPELDIDENKFEYSFYPENVYVRGLVDDVEATSFVKTENLHITKAGEYTAALVLPQEISAYISDYNNKKSFDEANKITLAKIIVRNKEDNR